MKKILCLFLFIFGVVTVFPAHALELIGEEGVLVAGEDLDWQASMDGDLRLSYNSIGHVLTLDWNRKNDVQDYMGYQYGVGLDVIYQDEYEGYIRFASFGPTGYDAPLVPLGEVHTLWGDVHAYRGHKLLPHLQEWWLDTPVYKLPMRVKAGLFTYTVGSGLALGGYYENYGVNLYNETENLAWTLHFDVPDVENKWYLGPKINAEREGFGIKYNSEAYFFAGDVVVTYGDHSFQPYLGILVDRTHSGERTSIYVPPVDTEYLGTYGGAVNLVFGDLSLEGEAAANFGKAWSADPMYEDMTHSGYMFMGGAAYSFFEEKAVPRAKFYYISGNKWVGEDITDMQLIKGNNSAFSTYSPTNSNLADTHYPAFEAGPYVYTGMGYNLNQGILRPETFYDPYQMTNLVAPNAGIDLMITDQFFVSFDYWYLNAAEPPIGADYDVVQDTYSPYTLPRFLGNEIDLYAEYHVNDHITFSFLGGIFFPGEYYHKNRGDEDVMGVAAAPRFDGGACNAWIVECAVTYAFGAE